MDRRILPTCLNAYCWLVPSLAKLLEGQGPSLPQWCLLESKPLARLLGEPIKGGPGKSSLDPKSVCPTVGQRACFSWSWVWQASWPFAQQCDLGRSLASLALGNNLTSGKSGFPGRQGRPEAQPRGSPVPFHLPLIHVRFYLYILLGHNSTVNTNQDYPMSTPRFEVCQARI